MQNLTCGQLTTWFVLVAVELLVLLGGTIVANLLPPTRADVLLTLLGCLAVGCCIGNGLILWQWRKSRALTNG